MRSFAVLALSVLVLAAACTTGGSSVTTTAETTSGPPRSVTSAVTSTTGSAPATALGDPAFVALYEQDGFRFYTEGSFTHLELFRYFPESEEFPVPVAIIDQRAPPSGTVLLDDTYAPGTYELRSYQRRCNGSCYFLEPPSDGCATRFTLETGAEVQAVVTVRPGSACLIDVVGATVEAPVLNMDLTLHPPGAPGCDPASPSDDDGLEVLATSSGDTVAWGLVWPPVNGRFKIVFRMTGQGDLDVVARHEDGTEIGSDWRVGGGETDGSSYGRPGPEWAMVFTFPSDGCWNIHLTRGEATADVWLLIEDPPIYMRSCEEAISTGPIGGSSDDDTDRSLRVGPVLFGNALAMATFDGGQGGWGPDPDGRYPAIKIPLTVERGTTVILSVPATHQNQISLIYQPSTFRASGRYGIDKGLAATGFEGCESGDTFFNGGFIVTGPGCYPIIVSTSDGQEHTAILPVGVTGCG